MPAISSTAEISFSSLRRLKVCLHALMTREGLNSIMALHIQQRHTDELDLRTLANEFISLNEQEAQLMLTTGSTRL